MISRTAVVVAEIFFMPSTKEGVLSTRVWTVSVHVFEPLRIKGCPIHH